MNQNVNQPAGDFVASKEGWLFFEVPRILFCAFTDVVTGRTPHSGAPLWVQ
jgi:hypothetical protein